MEDVAKKITITQPDDWHLHVRDGSMLRAVIPHTAARFGRAIIMPNLRPPVTTTNRAVEYRQEILAALPAGNEFQPLMTLYLTEETSPAEIAAAKRSGVVYAVKWYPAGATTHSQAGVHDIKNCYRTLESLQELDLPLLVHPEVTDADVDIFDREAVFIQQQLAGVVKDFPELRLVVEHLTTRQAVQFVADGGRNVAGTITPQHLLLNRNAIFVGGLRPHHYCLPVLKRETHRESLVAAAVSGNSSYFLGTDSAPHPRGQKESDCGCAGVYSAHAAIELYAEVFESAGALDKLEGFASFHGADFYGLPRNRQQMTLEKRPWSVPEGIELDSDVLVPFRAGGEVNWRITDH